MLSKNEQEQKSRRGSSSPKSSSLQDEVTKGDKILKHYYKPPKEDHSLDFALIVDDYDELHQASDPVQQLIYED